MKADVREWLEPDGLGGFASGTVSGIRTRRYHALLLPATTPPTGRFVLVNGFDAWLETSAGTYALSTQAYPDGVEYPNGRTRIERFDADPWPTWTFHCEDGTRVMQEIFAPHEAGATCLCFTSMGNARLLLRPFFSGRDYHALHHENPGFQFAAREQGELLRFAPYPGVPPFVLWHNGHYQAQADWYRQFFYAQERARGLDFQEDLASPGTLTFDLTRGPAALILATDASELPGGKAASALEQLREKEAERRRRFPSRLHRAADAYVVRRGRGKTVVAGYPWFTDWGRDTFISLPGLCLSTGRLEDARAILLEWAKTVSEGMLPNRFADGDTPEFNSVDASLWFVVTASRLGKAEPAVAGAIEEILTGYSRGTRHGIRADSDGLLAAGEPGQQLTWMDARVEDWVVTPRIGKPVEVQALWINALEAGGEKWRPLAQRARASFAERFWNPERRCLYDVVDVDHQQGQLDASLRPNQIFAVGGLPSPLLDGERARAVVDAVERHLWTPVGPRSLAPGEPGYCGQCFGPPRKRDGAYHQGTVWPWLTGAFVDAFLRVKGDAAEARERFLPGLMKHLDQSGIGHVSEIADAEPPHEPRGCPFQAWSTAELLRIALVLQAPLG